MSEYDTDFYAWTQRQAEAYPRARRQAHEQTGLPSTTFPEACPWSVAQVLDEDFLLEPLA
jgi:hypothetical protein